MNRRAFFRLSLGGLATGLTATRTPTFAAEEEPVERIRNGWRQYLAPSANVADAATPLSRPDEEWLELLGDREYEVLREGATEAPFTSPLNDEKRPGVYVCTACDLPLFSSAMKFDSGTGWPSFFTTIPGAFETELDFVYLIPRTEYHCSRCGGHHGHIFDDGPPPTGERWCNNGTALRFIPRDS